jgi:NRAMP (natural resistance-associated macrophage protein)-like metal ion transporter
MAGRKNSTKIQSSYWPKAEPSGYSKIRTKSADRLQSNRGRFRRLFAILGPGLITGAADDDPSSVGTYSVVGAQLGTSVLWTALITWPLIAAVQMVCARIGIVTGSGLAQALVQKFPRPLVAAACLGLLIANTITVGADLSAMADAGEMLSGVNSHYYVVFFGVIIGLGTIFLRYRRIANILKWFALSLLMYMLTAFVIRPDWNLVLHETFLPSWPTGRAAWAGLVAILGTTISPYLFFWQASLELEEKHDLDPVLQTDWPAGNAKRLRERRLDIGFGTLFSNLAMYFIILTTAMTLHRNGITDINTTRDAAAALKPLAGPLAILLFTIGIVGVGLVAIPTLITSSAYALAETFNWKHGLHRRFHAARPFYSVIILSSLVGIVLDFTDTSPMMALYWAAIISGLIAPFLLLGILFVASDRRLMRLQPSPLRMRLLVGVAALAMFGAAIGMFIH